MAEPAILKFPSMLTPRKAHKLRRDLLCTLRDEKTALILDLRGRETLNDQDINLLLRCLACASGRDVAPVLVADASAVQIILEVCRIASLTPVCGSLEEALAGFGGAESTAAA